MIDNNNAVAGSPKVFIYLSGEKYPVKLQSISASSATFEMLERVPSWFGMLVNVVIGDLPSFSGYAREIKGSKLEMEFRPELHPSVVEHIRTL